jgi:hypothetical protein
MGVGDQLHMETATTADAMGRVASGGQTMATEWQSCQSEISGLAGQLGQGTMGTAFLGGFQEPAAQAMRDADQCCQQPTTLAEKGTMAVDTYQSAEEASAAAVRAPTAPTDQLP